MRAKWILTICTFILVSMFGVQATAKSSDRNNLRARAVIKKLKLVHTLEAPHLNFLVSPRNPVHAQNVSVLIQPDTTYVGREISLDAAVDGKYFTLDHPSKNIWVLPLGFIGEPKSFQISVDVFTENLDDNVDLRDAIKALDSDINRLTNQINNERDPERRRELQAQRDEKTALRDELIEELKQYRVKVGTQTYAFEVKENLTDPTLPRISSIAPVLGSVLGGTTITISGANFTDSAAVKVGGINATNVTFVNENTITAVTSDFGGAVGAKDVVITEAQNVGVVSTTSHAGFFAADPNSTLQNIRPVAVTTGYTLGSEDVTTQLDGSQSYDSNGDVLRYEWSFLAVPTGSNIATGNIFSTAVSPTFVPDAQGTFVAQLRVIEASTLDHLASLPSLAVVSVGVTNNAPAPTAPSITVLAGGTANSQITPNDPDAGQTFSYAVTSAPAHGTASVDASGLVTFTADTNFTGSDSVAITVTDSGSPARSGSVTIPITITTNNHAPVPTANAIVTHSELESTQIVANDPDAGQTFTYQFVTLPQHGGVDLSAQGVFTYQPNQGYVGSDSVTIRVIDNGVPPLSGDITIPITVEANTAPAPTVDPVAVISGDTITAQVAANDPDAGQVILYQVAPPGHGTATISSTGLITYTANTDYVGPDSVSVVVFDNGNPSLSGNAVLNVTVNERNQAPSATAPAITSHSEVETSQITVSDPNAGQTHTFTVQGPVNGGTATVSPEGLVTFTPVSGFSGSTSVDVLVADNGTPQLSTTVSIPVNVIANNAPTASAPGMTVGFNTTRTTQITYSDDANQTDTFAIVQQGTLGAASVSASGLVSYTAGSTEGADTIVVRVSDNGNPALFTDVTISVNVVANFAPTVPAVVYLIRTRGVPYQVALGTANAALITDSDGSIASATWDFGDGTHEKALDIARGNILHNYVAPGSYTATLTAVDNLGATSSSSVVVNVVDTDIPTAKFRETPPSGATPLTVNFDASEASDSDGIVTYLWLFGDGTPETVTTSPTISHVYNSAGNFQVRLRTRDSFHAEGIGFANVFPGGSNPGTISNADFQVGPPREVLLGSPLAFDGSRSFNPNVGGALSAYNWKFADFLAPDGTGTATGITTSYTYPLARNYFPILNVVSGTGSTSQPKILEVFNVNAGHAPKNILRVSATSGVAPLTINVNGSESYDYDGTIQNYLWDFADGTRFNGPSSTSHTFTVPNTYGVLLEVTDDDGNTTFNFQNVTVTASKKDLPKAKSLAEYDPDREYQRQVLTNACWGSSSGEACYELGQMYQQDGDSFTAQKLSERACNLGYTAACGIK